MKLPDSVKEHIEKNCKVLERYNTKLAVLYRNCYASTINTALEPQDDGSIFVLTGDIPAMWLRDSSAQVNHYLPLAGDPEVAEIIRGVIRRQLRYILIDSYANAFNIAPNGKGMVDDRPKNGPWVWERKYEVDSLCYPIRLLYGYYKATGDRSIIDGEFPEVMGKILDQWKMEQDHFKNSEYRFFRDTNWYTDTMHFDGMGAPVGYTGMTWSGFRASDDSCTYNYHIPDNMFAVVVLGYAAEMLRDDPMAAECLELQEQIRSGIQKFAVVEHPKFGKVYANEVDGLGNYRIMDDANVPSCMSMPYIG